VSGRLLTPAEVARVRELRYTDGLTMEATAMIVGCHTSTVKRHAPGHPGKIPNDRLREAFLASGRSACEVALAIGWTYLKAGRVTGDGSRLRRALGVRWSSQRLIDAEAASQIAEAIGVGPWEIGA